MFYLEYMNMVIKPGAADPHIGCMFATSTGAAALAVDPVTHEV